MEFLGIHNTEEIPSETLEGIPGAIAVATFEGIHGRICKKALEVIPKYIAKGIKERVIGVPHLEQMLDESVRNIFRSLEVLEGDPDVTGVMAKKYSKVSIEKFLMETLEEYSTFRN